MVCSVCLLCLVPLSCSFLLSLELELSKQACLFVLLC